jgi:hypothetical protein
MLDRVKSIVETENCQSVLEELGIEVVQNRGNRIALSNGSSVLAMSASKNSKIEGHTHHVVIAEEAQDIETMKMRKSIHPMIASTMGIIIKIGTANTFKGDFYQAIKHNARLMAAGGARNHFFFPYQICMQFNSLYRKYVAEEKLRIGENSDEFRMAYGCEWLLERGMFMTDTVLMSSGVAQVYGEFSEIYTEYMGQNLVVGIDLGKETDSTVVTVIDVDWATPAVQQTIIRNMRETDFVAYDKHIVAWAEFQGDDYEYQYFALLEWLSNFGPIKKIVLDATRESSFADRIAHTPMFADTEVVDFIFGIQTKAAGYRLLHTDISSKRLSFPAGTDARADNHYSKFVVQMLDLLKDYSGGYMSVSHPDETGAHDDYPDSAMLANWGANEPTEDMAIEQFSSNVFI